MEPAPPQLLLERQRQPPPPSRAPAQPGPGRESLRPRPPGGEPSVSDWLGPFYLLEQVGEGGMGRVFRAVHERLGRQAAIKLLRRSASDGDGVRRFLREARAVNKVRHPGVIEITDIVEAPPRGDSYYVMEWLEGKNLYQRMTECGGQVPPREYLPLLADVAGALHAAHEAGLVHRDLKPENIFLVDPAYRAVTGEGEGRRGLVKVLDFGVALDLSDRESRMEDYLVGTPPYISPEQTKGSVGDARSDIYALGVVLYELAVGKLPGADGQVDTITASRKPGGPQRPRQAAPRGAFLPRLLEQTILRCMAEQPAERYQTMLEVREALLEQLRLLDVPDWRRGVLPVLRRAAPAVAGLGLLWASWGTLSQTAATLLGSLHGLVRPRPPAVTKEEPLELEVEVHTQPPGAEVRYGGQLLGVTPCVVRLPEGVREIELVRVGYRKERRTVDVRIGARVSLRFGRGGAEEGAGPDRDRDRDKEPR